MPTLRLALTLIWAAVLSLTGTFASADSSEPYGSQIVTARLLTAENAIHPDAQTLSAALHLELADDWKTYWKSPGEVGFPTEVDWQGSSNIASVDFLWPAPKRFVAFDIENYGYSHDVTFPLKVSLATPGLPATLNANVSVLVCKDICVPESFVLNLVVPAGSDSGVDINSADLIAQAVSKVPDDSGASGLALIQTSLGQDQTKLTALFSSQAPLSNPSIFPDFGLGSAFGPPDFQLSADGKQIWVELPVLALEDPLSISELTLTDGSLAASFLPEFTTIPPTRPSGSSPPVAGLLWITFIAFIGGVILNVMPCVLPVLSIKFASALKSTDQSPARIRAGFLMSALGVLSFMWTLVAILLVIRLSGGAVGWGLQFQSPIFLAVMISLISLFAANMLGLFEITLPQSWNTNLANADGKPGLIGDFGTGALAAILATPCSAPFLGTAVTFALGGTAIQAFLIFTALGLGLALPYILVAMKSSIVYALPKPGNWMVVLKLFLGALLGLTALWLTWVLSNNAGWLTACSVIAALAIIILALATRPKPILKRGVVIVGLAAVILAPTVLPQPGPINASSGDHWIDFDQQAIASHVANSSIVFVDVTADWCLTCKANKSLVLQRDAVRSELVKDGVVAMRADWTRPNDKILAYLKTNGRFGIPFNIVYGPSAPQGIVLPELLTQDVVLNALKAARD